MKMNLSFEGYVDEIEFEAFLGNKASKYQEAFEAWYYETCEEKIDGKVILIDKQRADLSYEVLDAKVILDWIKEVSATSNPRLLRTNLSEKEYDKKLPTLYF